MVVPCIEMATAKDAESGESMPLAPYRRYRIVVSPDRPKGMNIPDESAGRMYLVEAQVARPQRSDNPPAP